MKARANKNYFKIFVRFFENYDILCGKVNIETGFKKSVESLIKSGEITVEKE